MEKCSVNKIIKKAINKDPRWQLVLGYKNKRLRILQAIRKLDRVIKQNESDKENPVQYENKNMCIRAERQRLSEVMDIYKIEMDRIISKINEAKPL